jgi:hypothetical protein
MAKPPAPRWWEVRSAQSLKPATYRCPLCGEHLPALGEHMLMFPEGDHGRRRHAHTRCVLNARRAGRLPTRAEWQRAERDAERAAGRAAAGQDPGGAGPWRRWRARLTGRAAG